MDCEAKQFGDFGPPCFDPSNSDLCIRFWMATFLERRSIFEFSSLDGYILEQRSVGHSFLSGYILERRSIFEHSLLDSYMLEKRFVFGHSLLWMAAFWVGAPFFRFRLWMATFWNG